jgi:hypothetical protein
VKFGIGTVRATRRKKEEVPMSPFFAALIACGYMASIFLFFGLVWREKNPHLPH